MKALKRGGCYALVAGSGPSSWLGGLLASLTGSGRVIGGIVRNGAGVQAFLKELVEGGKLRSVIDRSIRWSRLQIPIATPRQGISKETS